MQGNNQCSRGNSLVRNYGSGRRRFAFTDTTRSRIRADLDGTSDRLLSDAARAIDVRREETLLTIRYKMSRFLENRIILGCSLLHHRFIFFFLFREKKSISAPLLIFTPAQVFTTILYVYIYI